MVQNKPKWRDVKHKWGASKTFGWIGRHDPTYRGLLHSRDSRENLLFLRCTNVQLSIFVVVLYKYIRSVIAEFCVRIWRRKFFHIQMTHPKGVLVFVNRNFYLRQNVVFLKGGSHVLTQHKIFQLYNFSCLLQFAKIKRNWKSVSNKIFSRKLQKWWRLQKPMVYTYMVNE